MKNFKILSIILGIVCVFLAFVCIITSCLSIKTASENRELEKLANKRIYLTGASIDPLSCTQHKGALVEDVVYLYGLPHETSLTFCYTEISAVQRVAPRYMTYGVDICSGFDIKYVQYMVGSQKQPDGKYAQVISEIYTFTSEEEYRAHLEKQYAEWIESLKQDSTATPPPEE